MAQQVSPNGLHLIKNAEGLRLEKYKDPVGLWTIGYGHLIVPGDHIADEITPEEADALLLSDVAGTEFAINKLNLVLTQNQYDALVSFVFNVGTGSFKSSTLLHCLYQKDYAQAANEFLKWDKGTKNGVLIELPGLKIRRTAERDLFLKP